MSRYLTSSLVLREQRHRRVALVAIAGLLLLSTGPVFGHHVSSLGVSALDGLDHLGALCLTAVHLLLEPVHAIFHYVIIAGLGYSTWDRVRAWRLVRRTLRPLETTVPSAADKFGRAAQAAGIDPGVVRVVEGLPAPAFTVGWIRPRIYVAASLAVRLSPPEIASIIAHEGAHVARRDPLRLSLLRFFACTLFWIPALRRLADDLADEAEVLADDAAASDPLVLASAIVALADWPRVRSPLREAEGPTAVGFMRPDLLERRIRRLAGENAPVHTHVTHRSLLAAAVALSLVWASGLLAAHPLSAAERAHVGGHCVHRGDWALAHLFCGDPALARSDGGCPHDSRPS